MQAMALSMAGGYVKTVDNCGGKGGGGGSEACSTLLLVGGSKARSTLLSSYANDRVYL